eukprot:11196698-Prorocentrum_lima.AAC.1
MASHSPIINAGATVLFPIMAVDPAATAQAPDASHAEFDQEPPLTDEETTKENAKDDLNAAFAQESPLP